MRLYPSVPHPYIIEPPLDEKTQFHRNDLLSFRLILVGKAQQYFPYLVYSIIKMAPHGLGAERARFELVKVRGLKPGIRKRPLLLFKEEENQLRPANTEITHADMKKRLADFAQSNTITLRFLTPLRLRSERRLASDLDFLLLVKNLVRRLVSIQHFHCGGPPDVPVNGLFDEARRVSVKQATLSWRDWQRFSSRQQQKMTLGGLIGEITFAGDFSAFLPLLLWGELLHVGRATAFGLGRYALVKTKDKQMQ